MTALLLVGGCLYIALLIFATKIVPAGRPQFCCSYEPEELEGTWRRRILLDASCLSAARGRSASGNKPRLYSFA